MKRGPKVLFSFLPSSSEEKTKPAIRVRVATGDTPRKHRTTSEQATALKDRARQIALEQAQLEAEWPEDVTAPFPIPTIAGINWAQQPPVPAEKIDWSRQGEPLRVRPTVGGFLAIITLAASVLGSGAYFYHGVQAHVTNRQIHVPEKIVDSAFFGQFETHESAQGARKELSASISRIGQRVERSNDQLRDDLIRLLKENRRK